MGQKIKWKSILDVEVQHLMDTQTFSRMDLSWTKISRNDGSFDLVGAIPYIRLKDFIRGEESNPDALCTFVRKKHTIYTSTSLRVSSTKTYEVYWCSYGPEDKRGAPEPPIRKRRQAVRRGCQCHFKVKVMCEKPDVAIIFYNDFSHEDVNKIPCHGTKDPSGEKRLLYAPRLSKDVVPIIEGLCAKRVPVDIICEEQYLKDLFGGVPRGRNGHLFRRDVANIYNRVTKTTSQLHDQDTLSVDLWYQQERQSFFFYQKSCDEDVPFVMGIQTPWMLEAMLNYSHNSLISMASTSITNKHEYQLYTLLAFDSHENGVPVAWVVTSRNSTADITSWLQVLHDIGRRHRPDWKVNAFMSDDLAPETEAIRSVFGCRNLLCTWHVRRAWLENVRRYVKRKESSRRIFEKLGNILHAINDSQSMFWAIKEIYEEFQEEKEFLQYFTRYWVDDNRIGMWAYCFRDFPHANQETSAAIKLYHSFIKRRVLVDRTKKYSCRTDWLIFTLLKRMEPYYKNKDWLKQSGLCTNYKLEKGHETLLEKSRQIPDEDCAPHENLANAYWVRTRSQNDSPVQYLVSKFGPNLYVCDCKWALRGNTCEHMLKVTSMLGMADKSMQELVIAQDLQYD
ncbi:uncharacterized protein LOC131052308 [Cryptomeria japonica]|uniref:uncharacterized protein LOC131052308 n=1 Tax=Cryptomeria japonica TaxID=3369 RepID=UPI0025AD17BF|nr:uncharacterized protein LOC131052308 [Cryptomeria japonica]